MSFFLLPCACSLYIKKGADGTQDPWLPVGNNATSSTLSTTSNFLPTVACNVKVMNVLTSCRKGETSLSGHDAGGMVNVGALNR